MAISRVIMVGGGAQSEAVRRIAPQVFGCEVLVPPAIEAVSRGAARQAAWALAGTDEPPHWAVPGVDRYDAEPVASIRERYAQAREHYLDR
jgi:xylulokinase